MIPNKLYHATYRQFLEDIQLKGLGATELKMWADSRPGVVYLANNPWVAESYAETAEWPEEQENPEEFFDNIIVLEIDTTKLDQSKFKVDSNVLLDKDEENTTWEYHGIIPWEACKVFNTDESIYEEYRLYETMWEKSLEEAKRIISDPDILYHWTNPTPLFHIFTENCLRADIHLKAVCLTTDENYRIYGYPCGIHFSRKKLLDDGYQLDLVDEFEDDPFGGESEERIYKNIENVAKYVVAVYVNWNHIDVVRAKDGDRIADADYDEEGNENENYNLRLSNFMNLLDSLKSKGIKIIQEGQPEYDEYYLDNNDKLVYGKMPA